MATSQARLDLHLHTTYSDGSLSPAEVLGMAQRANVAAAAITDHDTVQGIPEAMEIVRKLGVEVIPGVELGTQHGGGELHVLGYFLDWQDPQLLARLASMRESRHVRNPRIIERLNALGLEISYDEVQALASNESIGRPHIARVLMNKGYVGSAKEAFDRYLARGKAAYVARELPDPVTAIEWIRAARGVPVLAHPTWIRETAGGLLPFCARLKEAGLMGVEVHYSTHRPADTAAYLDLARRLDLLVTGGSDFHGLTKPDIEVGYGRGELRVPTELLDPLRKAGA